MGEPSFLQAPTAEDYEIAQSVRWSQDRPIFQEREMPPPSEYQDRDEEGYYFCTYPYPVCRQRIKKRYDKPSRVKKHVRNHVKPVRCPKCYDHGTAEQEDMREHIRTTHPRLAELLRINLGPIPCYYCNTWFQNGREDNRDRHIRDYHQDMLVGSYE